MTSPTTKGLEGSWVDLLRLFERAEILSTSNLLSGLRRLSIDHRLTSALAEAVRGDNRPINAWLFSHSSVYQDPLAWIAPVQAGSRKRYAWMIGFQSPLSTELQSRFQVAGTTATRDPVLQLRQTPTPLLFVNPIAVSRFSGLDSSSTEQDSFAIFQTNYKSKRAELSDFEQRMVMNAAYLVSYRRRVLSRAVALSPSHRILEAIDKHLPILALMHTEGHNRGHFLGPWPYSNDKKIVLYEALEEFRACLAAIRLAKHAGLASEQLDALAVCAFLVRFAGYAFDAYCLSNHRRKTVREITVGLLFFQSLLARGAISVDQNRHDIRLDIDSRRVRNCLSDILEEIHQTEEEAVRKGRSHDVLRNLARQWYGAAFPNRNYSQEARVVYRHLLDKEKHCGRK